MYGFFWFYGARGGSCLLYRLYVSNSLFPVRKLVHLVCIHSLVHEFLLSIILYLLVAYPTQFTLLILMLPSFSPPRQFEFRR